MGDWEGLAFVSTPADVIPSQIPSWITKLAIQVAWGLHLPPVPATEEKLAELEERFDLYAWAWCQGPDCEAEARWHIECAHGYDGFIANMEEPYDAHGNSQDVRYEYPARYLEELLWSGPLGLTTTPKFASHMVDWQVADAVFMPQAFPLENHVGVAESFSHAVSWGWAPDAIRPLAQCYPSPAGDLPDPATMNREATELGVGLVPYIIEAAYGEAGQAWLSTVRPSIERASASSEPPPDPEPEPPEPEPPVPSYELIGSQHGITAFFDWYRQQPGVPPRGPGYDPDNRSTWPWTDKLERTLNLLAQHHDAWIGERDG